MPETGSGDSYAFANATLRLKPGSTTIQFAYHGNAMNFDYFTLDFSGIPATPRLIWTVPGGMRLPTCITTPGIYDDVNGNGRTDFADVVLYFNQMAWIVVNEPIEGFDYNRNMRIDFADVVWLSTTSDCPSPRPSGRRGAPRARPTADGTRPPRRWRSRRGGRP